MQRLISKYIRPFYSRMAFGFLVKFTGTIMDLFLPWILAYMIDNIIPQGEWKKIIEWGFVMLLCSMVAAIGTTIANRMASKVATDVTEIVRHDLFEKIMYLSNKETDFWTKPSLISRLTTDTYNVHQAVSRLQRMGVRSPILLLGGLMMTLSLDPVLAGVLFCIMPVLAVIMVFVSKKSIPMYLEMQGAIDKFVRLVREDISGIRVIKALSKTKYESERFAKINEEVVERDRKAGMVMAITDPSMNVLLNVGLVCVVIVGAYRVNAGTSEVGKILAFLTYFTIILNAMLSISKMFVIISKAVASSNRIMDVLESEDEKGLKDELEAWEKEGNGAQNNGAQNNRTQETALEFRHVTFSYHGTEPNLQDISFAVKKGETLGIIGQTGSGKSTIANLFMRFYDAGEGQVLVNGKDVRKMNPGTLREKFGVVFQNDTIFENTIFENVRLGRDLTEEQIQEALLYARAKEFVENKGSQVQEQLDIKGANLSGGQKQRVLIARALAAHPEFLILDDSSSALDYKTDAALRKEIREHFKGTTTVIIAQRISSIMHADHILVLEDGRQIGYGTHEELMKTCELYREISESQMGEG
ncbi:MAG: ABC transporter ATP-binding protein [bacterium]|nr:ABC transporter ATP-binding protein [bacterium]